MAEFYFYLLRRMEYERAEYRRRCFEDGGVGHQNKEKYYQKFADQVKGFMAQGSEDGFGIKYARGVNDLVFGGASQRIRQVR